MVYDPTTLIPQVSVIAEPNPLFKFASYNYLFTLSALTEKEIRNQVSFLNSKPKNIIARSGGIGAGTPVENRFDRANEYDVIIDNLGKRLKTDSRDFAARERALGELGKNKDIYIKNVDLISIPGANEKRRLTSVTNITMELVEPFGLSLTQKIRAAAFASGYVDHLSAPYLLTLDFVGFDELGNPHPEGVNVDSLRRVIPIRITNLDIDVNQAGSLYTLTAVPYNEFGFTNHYVYPRTSGALSHDQTKTATIDSAIGELERLLNKQIADEVKDKKAEKPDIYKIFIDESFEPKKYPLNIEQLAQAGMIDQSRPIPPFPSKNEFLRFTPSFSLIKILEELMKSHPEMDVASYDQWVTKVKSRATIEAYNSSDNLNSATDMFFRYFRIRSNLIVTKEFDNIRKVNVKIIEYVIEPYLIHAYSLAIPGVQIGNNYKNFVPKKYYYTFTGENRDIQELNINYKVAYYQTRLKDVEAGDTRKTNPKLTEEELSGATLHPLRRREISGEGTSNDDADLPLQSEVGTSKSADAGRTGPGSSRFDHFLDAFTHPQADMVTLDMQILGDPGWLGQSQFLSPEPVASAPNISRDASVTAFRGGDKEFVWNPRLKCYNSELADPIVEMKFKFPTDIDDVRGTYNIANEQQAVFSGMYRVTRVSHSFNNGSFTQNLGLVRYNNQSTQPTTSVREVKVTKSGLDGSIVSDTGVGEFAGNLTGSTYGSRYRPKETKIGRSGSYDEAGIVKRSNVSNDDYLS